jgi:hypothetical protein
MLVEEEVFIIKEGRMCRGYVYFREKKITMELIGVEVNNLENHLWAF